MQNTTHPAETHLTGHLAELLGKVRALLAAATADPDTLLPRVTDLADAVDELHVAVIDTGEQPLNPTVLAEKVRALTPVTVAIGRDRATDIYLDGLTTGIASALAQWMPQIPEPVRDAATDHMVASITSDPAVMDGLRERLLGVDSGPKNMPATVPGSGAA